MVICVNSYVVVMSLLCNFLCNVCFVHDRVILINSRHLCAILCDVRVICMFIMFVVPFSCYCLVFGVVFMSCTTI